LADRNIQTATTTSKTAIATGVNTRGQTWWRAPLLTGTGDTGAALTATALRAPAAVFFSRNACAAVHTVMKSFAVAAAAEASILDLSWTTGVTIGAAVALGGPTATELSVICGSDFSVGFSP
jgi:hypothetical protein